MIREINKTKKQQEKINYRKDFASIENTIKHIKNDIFLFNKTFKKESKKEKKAFKEEKNFFNTIIFHNISIALTLTLLGIFITIKIHENFNKEVHIPISSLNNSSLSETSQLPENTTIKTNINSRDNSDSSPEKIIPLYNNKN